MVAAAVVFPPGCTAVRGLRDSKMLPARGPPPARRADPAARARPSASAPPRRREIDRLNIRVATALAMRRAIAASSAAALLRGRPLPHPDRRPAACPRSAIAHEALVDGDALCQSIAAAAILAKTVRDRLMQRLAPRHPGYGWDTNVGYGTDGAPGGLRLHGPTRHHRLTFAPLAQLHALRVTPLSDGTAVSRGEPPGVFPDSVVRLTIPCSPRACSRPLPARRPVEPRARRQRRLHARRTTTI